MSHVEIPWRKPSVFRPLHAHALTWIQTVPRPHLELCLPLPAPSNMDALRGSIDQGSPIPDSQQYDSDIQVHRKLGTTAFIPDPTVSPSGLVKENGDCGPPLMDSALPSLVACQAILWPPQWRIRA